MINMRVRVLVLFSLMLTGAVAVNAQQARYCKVCHQKINDNDSINRIPHEFYEELKMAVTDAILNYKVWFGRPGSSKEDYLTPASKSQHGDFVNPEYLQWRDLLNIPDSIRRSKSWCLDVDIKRFLLGDCTFYQVERKHPYRLVQLYTWQGEKDTFNLPLKDSLYDFDTRFLVYASGTGGQFRALQGVSGNIQLESAARLRLPYSLTRDPWNTMWTRFVQFGVENMNTIALISDTLQGGKYRLYSLYNGLQSSQGKSLLERGALIKCMHNAPFDAYYELIFFTNDKRYTVDPDKNNFYEVRRVWDFKKSGKEVGQVAGIYPILSDDTRWLLKKLGTKADAENYCKTTYGVNMWKYQAGEDARPKKATY